MDLYQLEYPYLRYFISWQEILNKFQELQQFSGLSSRNNTLKIDYNNFYLLKLTDYFSEPQRIRAHFKNYDSPLQFYKQNKSDLLANSFEQGEFSYIKFENLMFTRTKFCNNFPITFSKALFDYYDSSQNILDCSIGWGDRLLAALASNKNYTGVDTAQNLQNVYSEMINAFQDYSSSQCQIIHKPFEDVKLNFKFDLVIASPPFFDLEIYEPGNELQAENRYTNLSDFLNRFLFPYIENGIDNLKKGGTYIFYFPLHKFKKVFYYLKNHKKIKYSGNWNFYSGKTYRTVYTYKKIFN